MAAWPWWVSPPTVVGELVTGHGIVGNMAGLVHWYLQLG